MIEVRGNLWDYPADVRVITTNGTVKKNGECVMGRGCALEAKIKWPNLAEDLGGSISEYGNRPHVFHPEIGVSIVSFPVKHNWYEKADPILIRDSAYLLNCMTFLDGFKVVVLPRPGCGNGGLKWDVVRKAIAPLLDDRFHVITF